MLSLDAALDASSDAEDTPAARGETSKESRREELAKTIETVRSRREALARETSATRRAVETAAADKAEGSDAVELPRAERLAALRDAATRKRRNRKAPADDGTRRIRVTRDARGDEQLELCGAPAEGASSVVMMAWERPYMEALVDALEITPADTVLEIGYGLGFSCAAIQRRKPRRHVVVECDATVRARIPEGVEVAAATWQAYLADANDNFPIHRFSAVFFDDFPIVATPSRGSRWRSFLEALRPHIAWAAPPRRVVGYCCDAERLRAALPDGYWLERASPFELTPPADCPYVSEAAGDRCFVVVIGFEPHGVYEPGA